MRDSRFVRRREMVKLTEPTSSWTNCGLLHGMAARYLDRSAAFDLKRAQDCVAKLLMGTRVQAQRLRG